MLVTAINLLKLLIVCGINCFLFLAYVIRGLYQYIPWKFALSSRRKEGNCSSSTCGYLLLFWLQLVWFLSHWVLTSFSSGHGFYLCFYLVFTGYFLNLASYNLIQITVHCWLNLWGQQLRQTMNLRSVI